ncbi:MAG: DUF3494 domain-containing protein [Phycisphaerales bacterium]|nr:MAG: DUF3494 domain-containing protein [Phycisphaerales bacterium]
MHREFSMHAKLNRNSKSTLFVATILAAGLATHTQGGIEMGTAMTYAVHGAAGVTNTGPSVITGDLGAWPTGSVTGFPPGIVNGTMNIGNAAAMQAHSDATTAYNTIAGLSPTQNLTGTDLGGLTLTPGVYFFASSAGLTGNLTLDAQGDPDAQFVFQIGSTLTTATDSSVSFINDADGCNVFWQVGSSATLGVRTDFTGTIIALAAVTLTTDATITHGRAIALTESVTMDSNIIDGGPCIPSPGALALLVPACLTVFLPRRRDAARRGGALARS